MMANIGRIPSVRKIAASPSDWTKNAWYTIKGVGEAVAICSEPLFIDNETHQKLLSTQGLAQLAWAMAKGIDQWSVEENA
jgi:N-acetylmuramoyl-L-alanine amidase